MRLLKKCMQMLLVLTVFAAFGIQTDYTEVSAADYDEDRTGSITVELNDLGTEKSGVEFRLYNLYDLGGEQEFSAADKGSSQEMQDLAKSWAQKAEESDVSYLEAQTDAEGIAVFTELPQSVYLIVQSEKAEYGTVAPFFAEIPYTKDGTEWVYDVLTQTKGESLTPVTPPDEPDTPSDQPSDKPDTEKPDNKKPTQVKTGDETGFAKYGILAALALGAIALCLVERSRTREEISDSDRKERR